MEIYQITEINIKEVALLFKEVFNQEPWFDNWTLVSAQKRLSEIAGNNGFLGYYALSKNKVQGAILGNLNTFSKGYVYYMYEFFTDPKLRHKGIGQELYNTLQKELKRRNCFGIFLTTKRDSAAYNFYKKNKIIDVLDSVVMFGKL